MKKIATRICAINAGVKSYTFPPTEIFSVLGRLAVEKSRKMPKAVPMVEVIWIITVTTARPCERI